VTKLKELSKKPGTAPKDFLDNIQHSPYWNVAWKICERRGIENINILHILSAMHEVAKIDNKIN